MSGADGDTLYAYVHSDPVNVVDPIRLSALGTCLLQSPGDTLGLHSLGSLLAPAGFNIISTRGKFKGAAKGTSILSLGLRKLTRNAQLPIRLPAPVGLFRFRRTKSIGSFFGRWLPVVGWGILAFDAYQTGRHTWRCMQSGACTPELPEEEVAYCSGTQAYLPRFHGLFTRVVALHRYGGLVRPNVFRSAVVIVCAATDRTFTCASALRTLPGRLSRPFAGVKRAEAAQAGAPCYPRAHVPGRYGLFRKD